MKKIVLLLIVLAMLTSLTSCKFIYKGDHPGLYTAAVNSLMWVRGLSTHTEAFHDPLITILETDEYGRILFRYTEDRWYEADYFEYFIGVPFSAIIIVQAVTDEFVYYYEDFNFYHKEKEFQEEYKLDEQEFEAEFTSAEISELKANNDWNQPLTLDQCVKKEFIYKKSREMDLMDFHPEIAEKIRVQEACEFVVYPKFQTQDAYGRYLYYSEIETEQNGGKKYTYALILLQQDLSYSIFMMDCSSQSFNTLNDYQEEIHQFKAENDWNCPPEN